MANEHQQNGGIPSWDTWSSQMTEEQRRYEQYRMMYSLHCRAYSLENRVDDLEDERRSRFVRDISIQAGSGFLGGLAGLYSFIKIFNPLP